MSTPTNPYASLHPPPSSDPTASWELLRAEWLRPKSPTSSSSSKGDRKPKTAQLRARIQALEELLSIPSQSENGNAEIKVEEMVRVDELGLEVQGRRPRERVKSNGSGGASWSLSTGGKGSSGGSTSALPLATGAGTAMDDGEVIHPDSLEFEGVVEILEKNGSGKSLVAEQEDEEEPIDGGPVIRSRSKSSSLSNGGNGNANANANGEKEKMKEEEREKERQREDLEKVTNGILTSFRQGRPLRDPLPLSLVTKLLYRSWTLDGTIPRDYVPPPPPPQPQTYATMQYATATGGGKKMQIGALKESTWREEKDVASGSDVI